jgi:hypothetical protein
MECDLITLVLDGERWNVTRVPLQETTALHVDASCVHYVSFKSIPGQQWYIEHKSEKPVAEISYTVISPEPGDMLVGVDDLCNLERIAGVFSRGYAEHLVTRLDDPWGMLIGKLKRFVLEHAPKVDR